jgi:hypothetical protein
MSGLKGTFSSQKRSRLEETDDERFLPIVLEDPIETISKLIEDLKQITSHLANNAYPILDDVYYIWFDHTFNMINIQTRFKYDHDEGVISDNEKVGIQLNQKNELIYYYEGVASERGVPFFLARHFEEIIKYVDEQVQIQDHLSIFNTDLFSIFLINFKGQRKNILYINNLQYNAWVTIAPSINMNTTRDVHNYFHLQIRGVGHDIRHKLSLGVNNEHQIKTVLLDDKLILAPEEVQALLFSPTSNWRIILKSLMKDWISIYGIRLIRVDDLQLQVHPITLEICPELVLNMYCGNDISHICYLNDDMTAQTPEDFDVQAEKNMFIISLMENLFDHSESRSIGISKYGYPYIHLGSDAKEEAGKNAARNLGKLFSKIRESGDPTYKTGKVLPDRFFSILKYILRIKSKYPDNTTMRLLSQLTLDSSFSPLILYSKYSTPSSIQACLSTFKTANVDLSDAERKGGVALERRIFLYLRENIDKYMVFASELIKGMTPDTKEWIKITSPENISLIIQDE